MRASCLRPGDTICLLPGARYRDGLKIPARILQKPLTVLSVSGTWASLSPPAFGNVRCKYLCKIRIV